MASLLFDLYGVLLHEQSPEALAAIELATGHAGPELWQSYWDLRPDYDAGSVTSEQYWDAVGERLGRPVADVQAAVDADFASWLTADDAMVEYVTGLVASGVQVGLLSNIPAPLAERVLVEHPWLNTLNPVVLSGRIGVAKPDPASFAHAVSALGVPAEQVLFLDDRAVNVEAARTAGLQGHVFTTLDAARPAIDAHLARP